MTLAWFILLLSAAAHVATLLVLFGAPCRPGPVFTLYFLAVCTSLLVVPITLVQQIRSPAGGRRMLQAFFLYAGALALLGFAVLSFMGVVMGFDSC
jgi:hypothetical protein